MTMDIIQRSELQTTLARTLKGVSMVQATTVTKLSDIIHGMTDDEVAALIAQAKAVNAIYPADITENDRAGVQRAYLSIFDKAGMGEDLKARIAGKLGITIP